MSPRKPFNRNGGHCVCGKADVDLTQRLNQLFGL